MCIAPYTPGSEPTVPTGLTSNRKANASPVSAGARVC